MTRTRTGPLSDYHIKSVSAPAMRRMAVILDDPNLIHLDPSVVRNAGLGDRVINQGPTNVGYAMDMLKIAFPGGTIRRFNARFLANVYGGDAVVVRGTVDRVDEHTYHEEVHCTVTVEVLPSRTAVAGTAVIHVPL